MPKIDRTAIQPRMGSGYPKPFNEPCQARSWLGLGRAAGLTQFGVNLVTLPPGAWSSQRHWHAKEDELVYVLSGSVVLVEDEGEVELGPGDCAGFPANTRNGHHLINRSTADATFLVVGSCIAGDWGEYSDIDLKFSSSPNGYFRKDGSPA